AGLLAKAVDQLALMLFMPPSSRAGLAHIGMRSPVGARLLAMAPDLIPLSPGHKKIPQPLDRGISSNATLATYRLSD
ncbi:hypothetical protein, partial [Pseudomonas corrugata]|uniref:hypothetical protein n=1 Tax=Pseudomonas corrugata TaxID=47879 RepID=UPI0019D6D517